MKQSPIIKKYPNSALNRFGGWTFHCVDAHTCGNPVRVVAEGGPALEGNTMSEKRQHFLMEYDWIRKGLMFEPRGHDMMSGSILYPPHDPQNDVAVLFIETSGCLPMCGHGTIGTITIAMEEGLVVPKIPGIIRMEAPAGLVMVEYNLDNERPSTGPKFQPGNLSDSGIQPGNMTCPGLQPGNMTCPGLQPGNMTCPGLQPGNMTCPGLQPRVKSVKLTNVSSFLAATELVVDCPELGELVIDVSYGGNFYAIVDVQKNFKGLEFYAADKLIAWARELRRNINSKYQFVHPEDPTINGCSHILWAGAVIDKNSTARNAVFYGDKAIDRSPCGTGTSARMAQWYTKGKLKKGDLFIHESIIGSKFIGTIEEETTVGGKPSIKPGIEGWARIYGYNTISIDPGDDPYAYGFQVL